MRTNFNIYFFFLLILMGCSDVKKDFISKGKTEHVSKLSKTISNNSFNVKVILEGDKLSFEVQNQKDKKIIRAINEFGEISFTSSFPIISYMGESISMVNNVFIKNDFLLFPMEDWNGNHIFYKIPLNEDNYKDTISPFFIKKEQYCLFNQRTGTLLSYERLKKEYVIGKESYFLTCLNLYSTDGSSGENDIQFCTQKEIILLENATPIEVKKILLDAVSAFFETSIVESYFR